MGGIARAAERQISEFKAQELANLAWAFATAGHTACSPLFTAVATAAESRMPEFKPQELANLAWAFATLGCPRSKWPPRLARTCQRQIKDFKPQELAKTAWAFAKAGQADRPLFAAIA